jgi:hypothetical protein
MSEKDLEGSGRGLFEVLSLHFPDVTEKSEPRTLPNTKEERIPQDRHVPPRPCLQFCVGNASSNKNRSKECYVPAITHRLMERMN